MKKKTWLFPLGILIGVFLLCGGILWYMSAHSLGVSVGRFLIAERGTYMVILDERSPVCMSNVKEKEGLFDGLENGDKILVLHDGIRESYPGGTGAYAVFKLAYGNISDIPEQVLNELAELGWWVSSDNQNGTDRSQEKTGSGETSEGSVDYTVESFAFTFGTYGISSYDSSTGTLIKTTDATYPEDYVTTMLFGEEEWKEISDMLMELKLMEYPEHYDPINAPGSETIKDSSPKSPVKLTVVTDRWVKTVECVNTVFSYVGYDEASQRFLDVCKRLQQMITETEEWKALPEYEFFYK